MKTVSIKLKFEYVESNLSSAEKNPQFRVYLDARFEREPVEFELAEGESKKLTVSGKINARTTELPPTAAVGIASFAWRKNEFDAPCLLDTGTTHITIGDMLLSHPHDTYERELSLVMHTAQNLEKGKIRITINRDDVDLAGLQIRDLPVNVSLVGKNMIEYINNTMKIEQDMPDTLGGTSRIRIPYDYSESGIELTGGIPLPAPAYAMSEVPKVNDGFFINAFQVVMARDGLDIHHFAQLNDDGQARAMAQVLCYVPQYMDYVSDTVDRNKRRAKYDARLVEGYENFGDANATGSGDCEDLGGAIFQIMNAFTSHRWSEHRRHKAVPHLRKMQQIAKQYIVPLSLDVVNGAKVQDENAPKGAHMNDNMIPVKMFRQWLRRTEEGRKIDAKLPYDQAVDFSSDSIEYPFMVGEGTGMYEVLGYKSPVQEEAAYVYSLPSLQAFKKPITHTRTQVSSFFVGSLVGITDYFFRRGSNYGGFWYTRHSEAGETRGALYADMILRPEHVGIKMQPALNRDTMFCAKEATLLRVPPKPLTLTLDADVTHLETNRHLEMIKQKTNRASDGRAGKKVSFYVRPYQLSDELANRIANDFVASSRITGMDYVLERLTDEMRGYQVNVYVS